VNVSRFISLAAEKEKTIPLLSENLWHAKMIMNHALLATEPREELAADFGSRRVVIYSLIPDFLIQNLC